MEWLRTPADRFRNLPDYPYAANYALLEFDGGMRRMHYIEKGSGDVVLCLHGEPSWSFLYRKFLPVLSPEARVICPDLFGFGRSDKPSKFEDYSFKLHFDSLQAFLDQQNLQDITLVCQDWGGLLGLSLVGAQPERFKRLVIMNTFLPVGDRPLGPAFEAWRSFVATHPDFIISKVIDMATGRELGPGVAEAYDAPFPSEDYKAGARSFPALVPENADAEGVPEMQKAREVLAQWTKPCMVIWGNQDPIMAGGDKWFNNHIPSRVGEQTIPIIDAGHFLQEDAGVEIAYHILGFLRKNP